MPLLVLYGIVVLLTPVAVIFLLVRVSKLREQLSNLKAHADNQIVSLQRQVAELNRRVQSLQSGIATRKICNFGIFSRNREARIRGATGGTSRDSAGGRNSSAGYGDTEADAIDSCTLTSRNTACRRTAARGYTCSETRAARRASETS